MNYPIWRGFTVKSYQDLLHVIVGITTKSDAQEFLRAYEVVNPHARENVGWAVGDLGREEGRKVLELFECPHPVFGTTYPTPQEAMKAGMEAGKNLLSGQNPFKNPNPWFVGAFPE